MKIYEVQQKLIEKYKYQKLPDNLSSIYREYFKNNIPSSLCINGGNDVLYTYSGTAICSNYDRIVIGDYGAFVEFSEPYKGTKFVVESGQEYRVNNEKYSKNVKYICLTIDDGSGIRIFYQKKPVLYADYLPCKYYVDVSSLGVGNKQSYLVNNERAQEDNVGCKYCKPIIECMQGLEETVPISFDSYSRGIYLHCEYRGSKKYVSVIFNSKLEKDILSTGFPIEYCPMCGLKIGCKEALEKFVPAFEYEWD